MTTIHTRQLQQYTQDNSQQYTQGILKYKMLPRVVEGNKELPQYSSCIHYQEI